MMTIQTLRPNVSLEEAIRTFSGRGLLGRTHELAIGPLQSVAEFYIPFRVFEVEVLNRGRCDTYTLGLDVVNGSLDPYGFEQAPSNSQMLTVQTRNRVPSCLIDSEANDLIVAKIRRLVFSSGFFRVQALRISAEALPGEVHIPYWIGFRGRESKVHMTVMDAVRRRLEGGKVRHLVRSWINIPANSSRPPPRSNCPLRINLDQTCEVRIHGYHYTPTSGAVKTRGFHASKPIESCAYVRRNLTRAHENIICET